MNYKKAYKLQLQGKSFTMAEFPNILFLFGPIPKDLAIIIRTTDLGAEAEFTPEDVWNKILTVEWILE